MFYIILLLKNNMEYESQFLKHIYVINLERKPLRWTSIQKSLNKEGLSGKYKRFKAIDGNKLTNKIIQNNTTLLCRTLLCNRGMIGGAMSHLSLWKHFVDIVEKNNIDKNNQWLLVFEDDAELIPNYKKHIINLENEVNLLNKNNHNITLINLNCLGDCYPKNKSIYNSSIHNLIPNLPFYTKYKSSRQISKNLSESGFAVSFQNYLIRYTGAKQLLSFIQTEKIHHHIDVMANKFTIHSTIKPFVIHNGLNDSSIQTISYPYLPILFIKLSGIDFLKNINFTFSVIAYSIFLDFNINHYIYIYLLIGMIFYLFSIYNKQKKFYKIFIYFIILDMIVYITFLFILLLKNITSIK